MNTDKFLIDFKSNVIDPSPNYYIIPGLEIINVQHIAIKEIKEKVGKYYNIPVEILDSNTRKREIVQARQIAMFFSKSLTKSSLSVIGSQIGDKDHATVLHACKTVNNLIDTDKKFRMQIDEIEGRLKG